MKLAIIVAASRNGVIGRNNQLPWHLPQDLKYFKAVTFGKPVIMGRKTYESIGRPLPGRTNIVITRDAQWSAVEGVIVVNSVEKALGEAQKVLGEALSPINEAMVIGGAEIYRLTLGVADKVYLTRVNCDVEGDAWFPSLDQDCWALESSVPGDPEAEIQHDFLVYKRTFQSDKRA